MSSVPTASSERSPAPFLLVIVPMVRTLTASAAAVAVAAAVLGSLACSPEGRTTGSGSNQAPAVRIAKGPYEGEVASIRDLRIHVVGSDPDGIITGYRYAIDPGGDLADDPEHGAGDASADALVWIETEDPEIHPWIPATEPREDGLVGSSRVFAVQAVDDRGLASPVETLRFDAVTEPPTARLLSPEPDGASGFASFGRYTLITARWEGDDPDPFTSRPLRVQWKLIRIENPLIIPDGTVLAYLLSRYEQVRRPNLLIPEELAVPWGEELPSDEHVREDAWWPPLDRATSSDELLIRAADIPHGGYAIAVRSVDELGAPTHPDDFVVRRFGPGNVVKIYIGSD